MSGAAMAGSGLSTISNIKQNSDRASEEYKNSFFYANQKTYIESVGKRKLELLGQQQSEYIANQKSQFAANGIGFSGSALDFMAGEQVNQFKERQAVKAETTYEANIAETKRQNALDNAGAYKDAAFMSAIGGVLSFGAYGAKS